ncbi:hypothetical protein BT96DRAFT_970957 [Gymnopus androsaceus JB14]|uniref:DUF6593 domain-containing protein n=1 Tax=Gymnopus androsaceus JB14 TaxID=1447944 RepID=A0A6A4IB76_9AGAR|nr:hypothetical protein BT96DRAFT_970957 [Gymnopus androsaceus JB14]
MALSTPDNHREMILNYEENGPPEYSITYTFSTLSANSMLLLPPSASPGTRTGYHISISQNCFTPTSWITISAVKKEKGGLKRYFNDRYANAITWQLPPGRGHLYWDISGSNKKCYCSSFSRPHPLLAEFILSSLRPSPHESRPHQPYQLEIYPGGLEYLDEIILSSLVIERKRTTPSLNPPQAVKKHPGGTVSRPKAAAPSKRLSKIRTP